MPFDGVTPGRLMLATEGTEHDGAAEAMAIALAARWGAELRVVYPQVSSAVFEEELPQHAERSERAAAQHLAALAERAARAGVRCESCVRHALDASRAIVAEVEAEAPDLLVIRKRGRQGLLKRLLLGEMVEHVLDELRCPALVVPAGAEVATDRLAVLGAAGTRSDVSARWVTALRTGAGTQPAPTATVPEWPVPDVAAAERALAQLAGPGLVVLVGAGPVVAGRPRLSRVSRRVVEMFSGPVLLLRD